MKNERGIKMVILYEVHDNLYVNMTNKCPCACTFCLRQTRDEMNHSGSLWLEREPSVEEVKNEFSKFDMNYFFSASAFFVTAAIFSAHRPNSFSRSIAGPE